MLSKLFDAKKSLVMALSLMMILALQVSVRPGRASGQG